MKIDKTKVHFPSTYDERLPQLKVDTRTFDTYVAETT